MVKHGMQDYALRPQRLEIHPHENCFLRCAFCINLKWREAQPHEKLNALSLKEDLLMRIVDDAVSLGIKNVSFSGGGEPLLNAATVNALARANSLGIATKLVTNGLLLDECVRRVLMASMEVRVSVHAATDDVFTAVERPHRAGMFDQICENVRALVRERNAQDSPLRIVLSYEVITTNRPQVSLFGELGRRLGVDAVMFEFPYACAPGLQCSMHDAHEISAEVAYLRALFGGTPEILFTGQSVRYLVDAPKTFARCVVPYHKITIAANGRVFPCCQLGDQGGDRYRGQALGQLGDQVSLRQVLDSPLVRELVKRIQPTRCPMCIPSELALNLRRHEEHLRSYEPQPDAAT